MIKAVLFDVGGVILDMKLMADRFLEIFRPDKKEDLWNIINIKSGPLCRGEMSELQFWKNVAKRLKRDIPDDTLKSLWIKDYEKLTRIDNEVMAIINSLRGNYKLGVLSNTIETHAFINKERGIFDMFDITILSYEVKMTKESKDIFILAAKKLGVKTEECLFIDDIKNFISTAKSVGMKTILFKDSCRLRSDLIRFGVRV